MTNGRRYTPSALAILTLLMFVLGAADARAWGTFDEKLTSDDFRMLESAMPGTNALYLVRPDHWLPKKSVAVYIPPSENPAHIPTIWISVSHAALLNPNYHATDDERSELYAALLLATADSGAAGAKWKSLYETFVRFDSPMPEGRGSLIAGAKMLAQLVLKDNVAASPFVAPQSTDVAALLSAVVHELTPAVPGVTPVLVDAGKMPKYDPLAHYAGWNTDSAYPNAGVVWLNKNHLKAHGNGIDTDTEMQLPYIEAFVQATCDSGHAGPAWKARYDYAAQADGDLGGYVSDRFLNREHSRTRSHNRSVSSINASTSMPRFHTGR